MQTPHEIMAMFEVLKINGPMMSLSCWDLDNQVFNNVLAADVHEPSLEPGSVHLMNLSLNGSMWRVRFCSPAHQPAEDDFEH